MVDWNMQSGRELFVVFAAQGGRGEAQAASSSEAGQPFQAPLPCQHGRLSPWFGSQANKETWSFSNPPSPASPVLVSDTVTGPGLSPRLWEQGKSKVVWVRALCLGFDFCGFVTDQGDVTRQRRKCLGGWEKPSSVCDLERGLCRWEQQKSSVALPAILLRLTCILSKRMWNFRGLEDLKEWGQLRSRVGRG